MLSLMNRRDSVPWPVKGVCLAVLVACSQAAMAQPVLPPAPAPAPGQGPGQGATPLPAPLPPPPQAWRIETYLGATVTATDNSGLSSAAEPPTDTIIDVTPRVVVRGRGAGFTLNADVSARLLTYLDSTQEKRILPGGTVALNARLIDRWIYLDTSVSADQITTDPYAVRTDVDSGRNQINTLTYRLSPYLKHDFTPSLSLQARSDNYWTQRRGDFAADDPSRDTLVERQTAVLEQRPLPLGFSAEAAQETTSYRTGNRDTLLKNSSGRAVLTYALDPTFIVGVVAGAEKVEFALSNTTDKVSGARFSWAPTERSEIKGSYERRFFGNGGALEVRHRSPFIGISISAAREPSAVGSSFVLRPSLGTVPALLDAIYTTRYPDPATRAAIVDSVIAGLALPNALGEPLEVFASYAQLRDSLNASLIFQGVLTTVVTRAYAIKLRPLNLADTPIVPALPLTSDNTQRGLSVEVTRRLTATYAANLSMGYAQIEGLGAAAGQSTTNTLLRLSFTQELSPKTTVTYGARYQRDKFELPAASGKAEERAGFIGVIHRF